MVVIGETLGITFQGGMLVYITQKIEYSLDIFCSIDASWKTNTFIEVFA